MSREYQPVDADIMANLVICPGCYCLVTDTKTIMHELICKGIK